MPGGRHAPSTTGTAEHYLAGMSDILPGAEPGSWQGDSTGVLVLHGFTGSPQSMRPLAEALAAAGFTVEMPLLPGHGTSVDDMLTTSWPDYRDTASAVFDDLAARTDKTFVAGLSMGGTLAIWLAAHRSNVDGLIAINAAAMPQPELAELLGPMVEAGETLADGVGNDVAKEGVTELAYEQMPLAALLSLGEAVDELQDHLAAIDCPVLILNAPDDHVVPPASSDHLAESVSGPVHRVSLDKSFHVATIDHDAELIQTESVAFVEGLV